MPLTMSFIRSGTNLHFGNQGKSHQDESSSNLILEKAPTEALYMTMRIACATTNAGK